MPVLDILISGVLKGGTYDLMAVGLTLIFGVMNIPSFVHGEFYMIGAYAAFFSYTIFHLGPIESIIVAFLVAFFVGLVIEKSIFYTLRKWSKDAWLMNSFLVTLGLSIILQNIADVLFGPNYKGIQQYWNGYLAIGGMNIPMDRVIGFLIAAVAIVTFWIFLNNTKMGRAIKGVSQNEVGAQLVGINLNSIHTLTFALGSALTGLAGAILLSLTPAYPLVGVIPLYKSWFIIILVGMGSVGGSIVGGFILGLLETFSMYAFGIQWESAISLTIIVLILLFKPSGLFSKKGVQTIWEII